MDPDPASATSAHDPRVVGLRDLQRDHRARDARGLVVVEDESLLLVALEAGCTVELLLEDERRLDDPAPWRSRLGGETPVPASQDALRALSTSGRLPRVVAAVRRHTEVAVGGADGGLALVGVSDAGNVGGILRTAAAFALPAVTLLDGCADPWGRKALRVGQGVQFTAGLVRSALGIDELRSGLRGPLVASIPHGGEDPKRLPADATVLLSSEHGGLDRDDLARCDMAISVPAVGSQSLGVSAAAAIVAYVMADARSRDGGAVREGAVSG